MIALQKRYSKAKASANRVVFTGDEVIPVPFTLPVLGTVPDFAYFRVQGRSVICTGVHVHFQVPSGDRNTKLAVVLADANNDVLSATRLRLDGVCLGGDLKYSPAIKMPTGSLWKMNVELTAGDPAYAPQGMTVTYQLRYANGPTRTSFWAAGQPLTGIGFYDINGTFVIQ